MNSLSYAILSILLVQPSSGYALEDTSKHLWSSKLSQIYPRLSFLEKNGYIEYEIVTQEKKPNKKVYSVTKEGIQILKEWIEEPPMKPINKDEFLIKIHAAWLNDPNAAHQLIENREEYYKEKLDFFRKSLESIMEIERQNPTIQTTTKQLEIRKLLTLRRIDFYEVELKWCDKMKETFTLE